MAILDDKRAQARREREAANADDVPEVVVSEDTQQEYVGMPEMPELSANEDVPPAYSEAHDQLSLHQAGFDAGAAVTDDGRVNININQTSRRLSDILAPTLQKQLTHQARISEAPLPPAYIPPSLGGHPGQIPPPRLNVVIQIVGSRGDVQPFVALGQVLKNTYGHRVRLATHTVFKQFVEENGLEFFNIGGDPAELMAFMVKHPGLMPGMDALKSGEITRRRKGVEEMLLGCWRSCIEAGDGMGPAPPLQRRGEVSMENAVSIALNPNYEPFVADAVIANPPSFAHIHIAEKLGLPVHLMFTMPWSPTRAFPQPLANIQSSNTDPVTTNYVSYALVEMMTWQGLGDVINRFRTRVLDLEPLSLLWAPGVIMRLRIPYTYCWSPALIPKPNDWGNHIDIAGFYFLNLASNYTPEPGLAAFLEAGPPPVYIGFGSIVVDDPNGLTRMIFDAVAETGVRALVSKGWGGFGADAVGIPDGVYMLGNVPHDWLFQHVSAVCHHGGAGTTAAGIFAGKPTIIVPFFGDQPFWGAMIARAGAGPEPVPYKELTASNLAEAIRVALKPETKERAGELGAKIREEKGADVGGQSFHQHLGVDSMRCSIAPSRVAVWRVRRSQVRLSALAAASLVKNGYLEYSDLKLFRAKEYSTEDEPWDPISAVMAALVADISSIGMAVADFPRDLFKSGKSPKKSDDSTDNVATDDVAQRTSGNATPTTASSTQLGDSTAATAGSDVASVSTKSLSQKTDSSANQAASASGLSGVSAPPSRSRTPAQSGRDTPKSNRGSTTPTTMNEHLDRAVEAGKSINNLVFTGARTPMNFCLGLARGFRNAPKLYNDDTVRPPEKVTSFSSGLRVAGKEFGYGLYDGISGLVTQPMKGAQKEGAVGLIKGFGKGIGGIVLKPSAAFWSVPGYTMAGVHAEIRSRFAQSAQNYIIASRIAQGDEDFKFSVVEERDDIVARWLALKGELKKFYAFKSKQKGKARGRSPAALDQASESSEPVAPDESSQRGWRHVRHFSRDVKKRLQEQKTKQRSETEPVNSVLRTDGTGERDEVFEHAIQNAVRQTSRGDPTEDARIEQAIRSSLTQIQSSPSQSFSSLVPPVSDSTDAASTATSQSSSTRPSSVGWREDIKGPREIPFSNEDLEDITDEEYQALIERAVQLSIAESHQTSGIRMHGDDREYRQALQRSQSDYSPDSPEDEDELKKAIEASQAEQATREQQGGDSRDDDEALRRAIEESQADRQINQANDEEEELRRAIQESEREHEEELARASRLKSEEEIVMNYVKRQSLAEEEFRRKGKAKQTTGQDEDEDLKRAIEESMHDSPGSRDKANGSSGSGSRAA